MYIHIYAYVSQAPGKVKKADLCWAQFCAFGRCFRR